MGSPLTVSLVLMMVCNFSIIRRSCAVETAAVSRGASQGSPPSRSGVCCRSAAVRVGPAQSSSWFPRRGSSEAPLVPVRPLRLGPEGPLSLHLSPSEFLPALVKHVILFLEGRQIL